MNKRKYIVPQTCIVAVNIGTILIGTSDTKINEENKSNFEYTKGQGSWGDVWGSDDDDE